MTLKLFRSLGRACGLDPLRLRHILWLVAITSFAFGPPPAAQTAKAGIDRDAAAASATVKLSTPGPEYLIGADDVLVVNVWKEPEISRTLPVRPDGNISLPLIGDLRASGLTPAELQRKIKNQLIDYLSNPEVTVLVQEAKSHKFNIIGEVEKPGSYVMGGPTTVLDAIAMAGGLREFARTSKIYVLRVNQNGSRVRLPFHYKQVIRGSNLDADVQLEPRDTVVVP